MINFLSQAATEVEPVIDPAIAQKVIDWLLVLTAGQPWGIWVYVGLVALAAIAVIARMVVQFTDGTKDDAWVMKYLGWIPTIISMKQANKISGKGKVNIKALLQTIQKSCPILLQPLENEIRSSFVSLVRKTLSKKGKIIEPVLIVGLFFLLGCPKQHGESDLDRLRRGLVDAQVVVTEVEANLPLLEQAVDTYCAGSSSPEWCVDIPKAKADLVDALAALKILLAQSIQLIDAGNVNNPAEITRLIAQSVTKVLTAYIHINAIILRHDGHL